MFNASLVERDIDDCHCRGRGSNLTLNRRHGRLIAHGVALLPLALPGGCATRPKTPPAVHPTDEVGPPLKSEAWKAVATAADQDRLARLGLAWQEALAEAKATNPNDVRN